LNINGAINTASLQAIVRCDDTINAQSTIQQQHVFTLFETMRVIIDPD
jgi:hypothetical protein